MSYNRMNLDGGEELYNDEFGERIQGGADDFSDEEEVMTDTSSEDEMTPSDNNDDNFGETLRQDDTTSDDLVIPNERQHDASNIDQIADEEDPDSWTA
jgi:hypothetical protein